MRSGRIFINYRREDSRADSGRIYDHLSARFPGRVFRDVGSLEPGSDWHQAIGRVISQSDACIVVIGSNWLNVKGDDGRRRLDNPDDTVRQEIFAALQRNVLVIPVLVGGAKFPKRTELPADLQPLCDRNALEMTEQDWAECCNKLCRALEDALRVLPQPVVVGSSKKPGNSKWLVLGIAVIGCLFLIVFAGLLVNKERTAGSLPGAADSPSATTPPDLSGNWMGQATVNGAVYSSTLQFYPDHSFRNISNGLTTAVGVWQSGPLGEVQMTNVSDLTNGAKLACSARMNGNSFAGNCLNRTGGGWTFTAMRAVGQPDVPTAPPRLNVTGVSMAELESLNQLIGSQRCTCSCGMTVLKCLQNDPTCNYSPAIAQNTLAGLMRMTR